jgi:hypothetical protein
LQVLCPADCNFTGRLIVTFLIGIPDDDSFDMEILPGWGAPRIHGELLKLGFDVSERTVSRYLRRTSPSDQARRLWATFLRNHREVIAAMDFLSVVIRENSVPIDFIGFLRS